ncbi:hypothetical protein [Burkholderia pseudomallei]|jgi:hypothetical protein|uniref:hypothetical protein n=1 Tax=Burkholderia pseudomallei TaxID=28450 RepID=UPI0024E0114D|nr:hypothetical protein [Burkholderia pseudomallei]
MKVTLDFYGEDYITIQNKTATISEHQAAHGDKFNGEFLYVVKTEQYSMWKNMGAKRSDIKVKIDGEEL